MTAPDPPSGAPRGRLWPWVTYPLRLGPAQRESPSGPFARLVVVHACSSAGDALVTVALAGSVFVSVSLHAARGKTALGLVCTVLPFIVVGPLVGPAIDRVRGGRRAMVAASAAGRVVACGFMAACIHSLWLFPAAFASLVCSKTYLVAKASLVPSAVDSDDDLVEANGKLAVGASVATSAAALVGAGAFKVLDSGAVLHLDMALLAVGAVLSMRLRPTRRARSFPANPAPAARSGTGRAARLAGRLAPGGRRRDPTALPPGGLALAAVTMTAMRAVAGLMAMLVVFAFRRSGAPLIWYGLVGASTVAGNLGGAALAPFVRERVAEERIVPAASLTIGTVALIATRITMGGSRPASLILGLSVGICASVAKLAFDSLVQRDPPDVARTRLFARFEATFQLGWVLAALIPVLAPLSLRWGFLVVAVLTLGAGLAFVLGWRRARRGSLPSWWPAGGHRHHPDPGAGQSPPSVAPGPDPVPLHPPSVVGPVGFGPRPAPTVAAPPPGPADR